MIFFLNCQNNQLNVFYLGRMKRLIRSGHLPLQQFLNRTSEALDEEIVFSESEVKLTRPNNWYIVNETPVEVLEESEPGYYSCRVYENIRPSFLQPFSSYKIGQFRLINDQSHISVIEKKYLKAKAFSLNVESDRYVLKLLHYIN